MLTANCIFPLQKIPYSLYSVMGFKILRAGSLLYRTYSQQVPSERSDVCKKKQERVRWLSWHSKNGFARTPWIPSLLILFVALLLHPGAMQKPTIYFSKTQPGQCNHQQVVKPRLLIEKTVSACPPMTSRMKLANQKPVFFLLCFANNFVTKSNFNIRSKLLSNSRHNKTNPSVLFCTEPHL